MQNSMREATKALYRWTAYQLDGAVLLTPIRHRVQSRAVSPAVMDDVCFFGEDVAVAFMRVCLLERDAARLGGVLPIDVLSSRYAVEVKAGLLGISANAQHWRLTFSAARGQERGRLEAMTEDERRVYRETKQQRIEDRKRALLGDLQKLTGRPIAPATVTMIVDPARRDVDVFWFEGWHRRIGWNSQQAAAGFRGSFHVAWSGRQ